MSKRKKTTLILCVDRDNDIGVKTGIKTPIIGREKNFEAASKLALNDPEESDANALFGAIRTYDNLSSEANGDEYAMATIVGSELGGITADRELRDQLVEVLGLIPSESIILVTDGFSDEEVIPIVQSHLPILSVRRIVVKHSERIEESWAVFSRYLKKLFEDPYYARWVLGAPGILLIALAILTFFASEYVGIVFLVFIGSLFVIRGFSIDKRIGEWVFPNPSTLIRLFTTATALIIIGLDGYQTYVNLLEVLGDPSGWIANIPQLIGWILYFATNLVIIASIIFLAGITIYFYLTRDPRIWWNVVGTVAILWMRVVALQASEILLSSLPVPMPLIQNLILAVALGIGTTLITILITRNLSKKFEHYFNKYEAEDHEKS